MSVLTILLVLALAFRQVRLVLKLECALLHPVFVGGAGLAQEAKGQCKQKNRNTKHVCVKGYDINT